MPVHCIISKKLYEVSSKIYSKITRYYKTIIIVLKNYGFDKVVKIQGRSYAQARGNDLKSAGNFQRARFPVSVVKRHRILHFRSNYNMHTTMPIPLNRRSV